MNRSRVVSFFRYVYEYFHIHIVMVLTFILMLSYCFVSINNRSYYINDSYISSILDARAEYKDVESLDVSSYKSSSVLLIGAINNSIVNNDYDTAIDMIDKLKKNMSKNITFYRYLTIRQALLYMNLFEDEEAYRKVLFSKYPQLGERVIKSILSVFRLRKDN